MYSCISCCLRTFATNYMTVDITAVCCLYRHYSHLLPISTLQPSLEYINITALCRKYQPYSPLLHISTVQSFVACINRTAICSIYQHYSLLLHISTTFKNSSISGISNNRSRNIFLIYEVCFLHVQLHEQKLPFTALVFTK
jgi:hypothetical protein